MIGSYIEYIDNYISKKGLRGLKNPGEHHFVSTYLVPKLYSLNNRVPDYVNPDGTKSILGDIVYYDKGKYSLGIEVKLGTIRLTANEFNNWILNENTKDHPCFFIGIGQKGLVFQPWRRFRDTYLELIGSPSIKEMKKIEKGKYGPHRRVNVLLDKLKENDTYKRIEYFPWEDSAKSIVELENSFEEQLKQMFLN